MALVNENYLKLPGSYLFSEIARRINGTGRNTRRRRSSAWGSAT